MVTLLSGTLTCFWPGAGEDGQGQQNKAPQSSELSHLHPDDGDATKGSLVTGTGSNCDGVRKEDTSPKIIPVRCDKGLSTTFMFSFRSDFNAKVA